MPLPATPALRGDVLESAVSEIPIQDVAGRSFAAREVGAVREQYVQQAIVVVIEEGDTGPEGLKHVLGGRRAVFVVKHQSGLGGHVDELHPRLRGGKYRSPNRQSRGGSAERAASTLL